VRDRVGSRNINQGLALSWADTTTAHGRLMLTVLGGLAEFERELIRARTDKGRKRAQARVFVNFAARGGGPQNRFASIAQ
jgi:DNA invertase Pin-like site-specific DNA recombinase